jgi:phospholipid/cholesterol/gamma-HCH transport system permease protein
MTLTAFATIGRFFLSFFAQTGRLFLFIGQTLKAMLQPPFYFRIIGQQILRIGYFSLPVVALTSFFTGGALAIQIYYGGTQFNSETIVSSIVALGITRELGPVLGGLMVAGRVSAAIAAEIGTMRVTEQIDALTTLSTDPFKYLVAPRVIAATLCMPILALVADILGVFGGFVVGTQSFDFNAAIYVQRTVTFLSVEDVSSGLIKAAVFGFLIATMGCYNGYYSKGGAQGVGRATTNAVVSASILILAANYLMTSLLFSA